MQTMVTLPTPKGTYTGAVGRSGAQHASQGWATGLTQQPNTPAQLTESDFQRQDRQVEALVLTRPYGRDRGDARADLLGELVVALHHLSRGECVGALVGARRWCSPWQSGANTWQLVRW